jgi:glucose-6-phosphate isomerase
MQFAQFPLLFITGKSSALRAIGEKLGAKIILHPVIGGRYTGMTEVGLVPAAICGLDAEALYKGAKKFYELYAKENLAWKAASVLYQLEQKGFVDVFMPFYAHNLFPMSAIIVQLCHESFGKSGRGQTYFAHEAPESQHHTNQRFFGGTKNICGFFTTVETFLHPTVNSFPTQTHSVQIKGHSLFDINKIPLEKAMDFEVQGTMEDARISGIPIAHLTVSGFNPDEIGQLLGFWQLFAVYSSVLRQVDPFDQPQVENSKKISFDKRLAFKGLL